MFLLDSLMIAGIRWTLETVVTAAEAELNDDTALREQLLEAEMRRELGEIDDAAFLAIEADSLARIRAIKERRDGGAGSAFTAGSPIDPAGATFDIEASVTGDFHEQAPSRVPPPAPVVPVAAGPPSSRPSRSRPSRSSPSRRRTARRRRP